MPGRPKARSARVVFVKRFFFRHAACVAATLRESSSATLLAACAQTSAGTLGRCRRCRSPRAIWLYDGEQFFDVFPEVLRSDCAFLSVHGVDVTQQRVDFAVVAHEAAGLGAIPRWEGIGAESGVHHVPCDFRTRYSSGRDKTETLIRRQHTLVYDDVRRQRAHVK